MSFKDKYTTDDLILKDNSVDKKEKSKTVLSNDFYMLGEYLECIINKGLR